VTFQAFILVSMLIFDMLEDTVCNSARRIGAIFGMLSRRAGLLATAGLSCSCQVTVLALSIVCRDQKEVFCVQ